MDRGQRTSRRQILRVFTVGGVATALVMPTSWTKPLVKSVIVPAHAQASPHDPGDTQNPGTTPNGTTVPPETTVPTTPPQATTVEPTPICPPVPNAATIGTVNGQCTILQCDPGFFDDDGIYLNGCELGEI
jgi:hypothetical protein